MINSSTEHLVSLWCLFYGSFAIYKYKDSFWVNKERIKIYLIANEFEELTLYKKEDQLPVLAK